MYVKIYFLEQRKKNFQRFKYMLVKDKFKIKIVVYLDYGILMQNIMELLEIEIDYCYMFMCYKRFQISV